MSAVIRLTDWFFGFTFRIIRIREPLGDGLVCVLFVFWSRVGGSGDEEKKLEMWGIIGRCGTLYDWCRGEPLRDSGVKERICGIRDTILLGR